ncbi:DUF6600 domain-containing protein [Myxococcus fulvus]|uniref:DUF6600 domain-containing protein n=1 Tax=Myxococcus fulvus TaxID=33 RepID=UPI0020C068B9|nr:DUF6600 domain-containing protein [Myxococcus fulvus]MCK8502665.1 hypothetical protein [Myxococcus fulvus]
MRTWKPSWRWLRAGGAGVLLAVVGCATGSEQFGPQVKGSSTTLSSSVSIYRDLLSPHGDWFEVPEVGWVWKPYEEQVGRDFVPYASFGQWRLSDWGWTFDTDLEWGWAAFHYGRWFVTPSHGWVWWPDDEWAPSWVDWRWGDGHIGWQPQPVPGQQVRRPWTFVASSDFVSPDVSRFLVPPDQEATLVSKTQPVGERVMGRTGQWNAGPTGEEVAQVLGEPVPRTGPLAPPTGQPPLTGSSASR